MKEGREPERAPTEKWPPRIRYLGAISFEGKVCLVKIPKKMKSHDYVSVLEEEVIPEANHIYEGKRGGWLYLHDGDGAHSSNFTRNWLKNHSIRVIDDHPAHSPDLNPIENLWAMMDDAVALRKCSSLAGLERAVAQEWAKLPMAKIRKVVTSMPDRLKAVIEAEGGNTKY